MELKKYMKKLIVLAVFILALPLAVGAHGGDVVENGETDGKMMLEERLNHEEMEGLMKKFMTEGSLSEAEADKMIAHMNELMGMGMMRGGRSGMMEGGERGMGFGMMGGHDEDGMMSGDMMEMMMWLHGLLAITALVWLVAGILYLIDRDRKLKNT